MQQLVVDASAALRTVFENQEGHAEALETLTRLYRNGVEVVAPDLFPHEAGNAFSRTGFEPGDRLRAYVGLLETVGILPTPLPVLTAALSVSAETGLSFYDSVYVAQAEHLGVPLWTEDREIRRKRPQLAVGTGEVLARL